jgi:hypothetical protein
VSEVTEMNAVTDGCIGQVRPRKTPRSGGTVSWLSGRCSGTETPGPTGVDRLARLGQLVGVSE